MQQADEIYHILRIEAVREEARDFKTIVFSHGHGISYKAGQYLTLVRFENGAELRRSYSILSSPDWEEPLAIGVKRVANGLFSRALADRARPGDEIITTGSGGFFVLPETLSQYRQLFFFAAGSGITPIYSLLKTALNRHPFLRLVLVYSNASPASAVFLEDLRALQAAFPDRFVLETLFSNAPDLSRARLHRDLIFHYLHQYMGEEKLSSLFYLCGSESYMRLCTYTLQEAGVPPAHIRKENFYLNPGVRRDAAPPDTEMHSVTLHLREKAHRFPVNYPNSILQAAKQKGLILPYSCEAGRCGNCVARCLKGLVWHSYNEVLTEKELARGLVLTCVGHPVGGDVEIAIG